jgi:hypothetical protein
MQNEVCCAPFSYQWCKDKVDASVLRGAVAFGGATAELVDDANDDKKRMSNRARKNILKVIVEQGFNGELHDDIEKAFMKKKRFKVFALTKRVVALHTTKSGISIQINIKSTMI